MQAPQSVQVSAAITNWSSPWLIASTGQVDSHAPQEIHSPEITCAMIILLIVKLTYFCTNPINITVKILIAGTILRHTLFIRRFNLNKGTA
jgi:hypothetical protein